MKIDSTAIRYALRFFRGEWAKYLLPLISLLLTAIVISTILLLTQSAGSYLHERNREMIGGDLSLRSSFPIDDTIFADIAIELAIISHEISFSATLQSERAATPIAIRVVDPAFPLVGKLLLTDGKNYSYPKADEILLDATAAERLQVGIGEQVSLGDVNYQVAAIIAREPDTLASGIRFYPRAILPFAGLQRSTLNPRLLRADYRLSALFAKPAQPTQLEQMIAISSNQGLRINLAGYTKTGVMHQLTVVERFLVITALITLLLACVNIYVSMLSLLKRLQRTFAILRVLGATQRTLLTILTTTVGGIVAISAGIGIPIGALVAAKVVNFAHQQFALKLPLAVPLTQLLIVILLILAATLAAGIPAWIKVMGQTPRALLAGSEDQIPSRKWLSLAIILATAIPFWLFTSLMLRNFLQSTFILIALLGAYTLISLCYRLFIKLLRKHCHRLPFMLHCIVAQKHEDGIFGTVAFASLFVALTAFASLTLCHASLAAYLAIDLSSSIPHVYVIDIQPSQADRLKQVHPDITLFPNVRARIIQIDGRRIQEQIAHNSPQAERELGREFNITYRHELMDTEKIVTGRWTAEQPGTFSVEREFAQRAGIRLGSQIHLAVQGLPVTGVVTSLRATDQRSGLPFFFIIGTPTDFSKFPATYFGYAYYNKLQQQELTRFAAKEMANVTVVDTRDARKTAEQVIDMLLLLTFITVLPSLLLATLLIVALILLAYASRRRDAARFRAIGASRRFIERLYHLETLSTTLFASALAYLVALIISWYLLSVLLEIKIYKFFTNNLLLLWLCLLAGVTLTGVIAWKIDKRPIQRTLSNEENY